MNFPGRSGFAGLPAGPSEDGASAEQLQQQQIMKTMQAGMESCVVKSVMAGGAGFVMGGMFGLFISSMSYDTPLTPKGQELATLSTREQLRRGFKDMGAKSYSSAKNFGRIGAIYAGTECCIEGYRAKNDLANGVIAGCLTGGAISYKAGPQAAAVGCAGFAAFSLAIDYYMRMPESED
ncbi:MAG: Mitochondrial import inner membrane translocase subunit tim22 [Vezdaea acicularis]|nr:MAG: Mitochondrial import inner membrane translocase subunit tim22 [Vezdaea acicularis]